MRLQPITIANLIFFGGKRVSSYFDNLVQNICCFPPPSSSTPGCVAVYLIQSNYLLGTQYYNISDLISPSSRQAICLRPVVHVCTINITCSQRIIRFVHFTTLFLRRLLRQTDNDNDWKYTFLMIFLTGKCRIIPSVSPAWLKSTSLIRETTMLSMPILIS